MGARRADISSSARFRPPGSERALAGNSPATHAERRRDKRRRSGGGDPKEKPSTRRGHETNPDALGEGKGGGGAATLNDGEKGRSTRCRNLRETAGLASKSRTPNSELDGHHCHRAGTM